MPLASDIFSVQVVRATKTMNQGFTTNHNMHEYMHTDHTQLSAINSAMVNQLSASFRRV